MYDKRKQKTTRHYFVSKDGKQRETDASDLEGIFRIVQSIPSPKAEPCKRWLAKVGKERIYKRATNSAIFFHTGRGISSGRV